MHIILLQHYRTFLVKKQLQESEIWCYFFIKKTKGFDDLSTKVSDIGTKVSAVSAQFHMGVPVFGDTL